MTVHEVDTELHQVFNAEALGVDEAGTSDVEEASDHNESPVPKKQKKRSLKRKAGKGDGDGEEVKKGSKKRKKGDVATLALTSSDRGRRSHKIGPKTGMDTGVALQQITNTLGSIAPRIGEPVPSPPAPPIPPPSMSSASSQVPIDPVLLQASLEAKHLCGEDSGGSVVDRVDDVIQDPGIPVRGPNDMPNPFTVSDFMMQQPPMGPPPPPSPPPRDESPMRTPVRDVPEDDSTFDGDILDPSLHPSESLSRSGGIPASAQQDIEILGSAIWPEWFQKARKYLDSFELGEDWTYLVVCYTLWEGWSGFQENTTSFPTCSSRPEQVAYWSKCHRVPVVELKQSSLLTFEGKWWTWWRRLQPSVRGVAKGEGLFDEGQEAPIVDWEKLICPGQNRFYSVLVCLAWWKVGIEGLHMNKGRLEVDWVLALKDVTWVISSMADSVGEVA